jgi:serine/threonine protein kinase
MKNAHPSRELLSAFMSGQLSETEQADVAAHVDACDACCEILRAIPDDPLVAKLRGVSAPVAETERDITGPPPLPKELLDHPRYKIGKFLGSGGMGMVYQAEHRLMDRQVALKIIHRDLSRKPNVIKRFHQEVKAAARLAHPNIVTAYDAEHAGDVHFLVMEFVDGISLERLVRKQGPLSIPYACGLIRQAARGLQHAFEAGMVHRDIKPLNLMLTRKGQVKILDFGLARLASETRADIAPEAGDAVAGRTRIGVVMGTPDFMAPEQVSDARGVDIRADIYSLGCTLYFLLTGQTPFGEGSSATKLFYQKYQEPRPITEVRADVPAELVALIERLMAKNPTDRPAEPAEVVKALGAFLRPSAVSIEVPAPVPVEAPIPPAREPVRVEAPPVEQKPRSDAAIFLAQCPFCPTRVRVPIKIDGASIQCPQCGSYFTAVNG